MKLIPLAVTLAALTACTTTPQPISPEAAQVRFTTNAQATAGCVFLGSVESERVPVTTSRSTATIYKDAENQLKVATLKLGGNLVFGDVTGGHGDRKAHGEAYRCSTPDVK